jgi:hypothetical protein
MAIPSEVEAVEYAPINNVQGFPRTGATFVPKRLRKKNRVITRNFSSAGTVRHLVHDFRGLACRGFAENSAWRAANTAVATFWCRKRQRV